MKIDASSCKQSPGRRHAARQGYALMLVIAFLAVMAILASVAVPDWVRQQVRDRGDAEKALLQQIGQGLALVIQRQHGIPGATNWVEAVARETGLNEIQIQRTYARFPHDANTERVYLIHPSLTPGTGADRLPYAEVAAGVPAGGTNAPTVDTRLMVVSNTRRELALPVSSGVAALSDFENLWNWRYDPVNRSPPAGWPADWNGKADGLQIERLDLADRFHTLTLKNLDYSLNGSYPLESVTGEARRHLLRGSLLEIYYPGGSRYASHIVRRDAAFDLTPAFVRPLLYLALNEGSGVVGYNTGQAGASGNLTFVNSPILGQAGPASLPDENKSVRFNGSSDYADSSYHLPSSLTNFTLALWIHCAGVMHGDDTIVGERDVLYLKAKDKDELTLVTHAAGNLTFDYDFPLTTWHHVAAVGNGAAILIYVDGVLKASYAQVVANYGNPASSQPFRLAGRIIGTSDYFRGTLDEVTFYGEALTSLEIGQLVAGIVP